MALSDPIPLLLGQSLVASGWNALHGLWDLRVAFAVVGIVGIAAAWGHRAGQLIDRTHAWWVSFLVVAALFVVATTAWLYFQGEEIALWMAESPETYRWSDLLLESHTAAITVGPIFALSAAYAIWAVWRWWYSRLPGWFSAGAEESKSPKPAIKAAADRGYGSRLHTLKRGLSAEPGGALADGRNEAAHSEERAVLDKIVQSNRLLLVLALLGVFCVAGFLVANRAHGQVAMHLQHGTAFVDATRLPHAEFPLAIAANTDRLRVVNINGLGNVNLLLVPNADRSTVAAAVQDWEFKWRSDDYLYQDIPVQGLAAGDYRLEFNQHSGWGYFEYTLSQGGGRTSQLLALVAGLLLAVAVLFAAALVALTMARLRYAASHHA